MASIPRDVWKQIGKAPTLTLSADQWHERGYVLVDGVVHRYGIDRKEQFDTLHGSWPLGKVRE